MAVSAVHFFFWMLVEGVMQVLTNASKTKELKDRCIKMLTVACDKCSGELFCSLVELTHSCLSIKSTYSMFHMEPTLLPSARFFMLINFSIDFIW